ncbi:CDP-6-deoxy-D-xylo-4-hexulose-3-dehydrase [Tistlia consotensis]|uniref:CDP-6-deoxy-D-xylo-4-hexulose-3-dehydrase n=1 Tax=Tistlia consotensis USBA 355 TaxID=560819 RepID=A0A1Y6CQR1_9PROT|nr:DegT/DnrJ/EryC1/StrS family aminotransferase [Tistlia consotensis]SMF71515.1 CDP-6-deoxy-D-xylo-4-hexulose-3-dehydrase [Tistlia consotensis USBA 355]SNS06532.1 CDP-6-deoxy-D-xylo-4-hexulose-3-dehydrase [Tistlia consotensis]
MYYELAAQTWGAEEIAVAKRVIESGAYTMGAEVKAFEAEFAAYFGVEHAIMVNSGSSANLVSVGALCHRRERPLQRGDEVIVPAISWATTYHPLQQHGLRLRFLDVALDTLNLDVERLEEALTPRTRAIVAVSILGNPAGLDRIRAFADAHGLALLEDNCESMDAELNGRKCGTFGDLNTFSFFFSHHISTMEGGMILTDDLELAHLCRSLRAHGWTRDLPPDSPVYRRGSDDHFEAYRFILPGYNVRPLEIEAAVGRVQLRKLPAMTELRRRNLALFQQLFAGDERFIIQREHGRSSAFSFTIILNPARGPDRSRVFAALKQADIGFRIITGGNFLRHDVIRLYDHEVVGGATPNADLAHDFGFFVGNHPRDLEPQIRRLREVLDRACG